ncbi:MAG: hypothetical protein ACYDB7_09980, partial [Mycobacteriales bacterium]
AVILGYLLAALLVAVVPTPLAMPRWLALHLLFLGAASNAIVAYSAHFAEALLHARPAGDPWRVAQLVGLNAGVVAVLTGVDGRYPIAVGVGAALVAAGVLGGAGRLARLARRPLAGRLRAVVWFYVAAAAFLAAGAMSGALLETGVAGHSGRAGYLVAFHAHVNLFGWIGLSVLGTSFMLWPATLRTRMAPNAPRIAQRVLMLCGVGLGLAAAGLLVAHPVLAAVGMTGYAAGVGLSLGPFTRALVQRRPHDMASGSLAAATSWLLGTVCWDVVALAEAGRRVELIADRLAPILAAGLVAQVLVGALSFLLPVLLGGGPAGNKRMATTLNHAWVARLSATNLGVLAAVLPLPESRAPSRGTEFLGARVSYLVWVSSP